MDNPGKRIRKIQWGLIPGLPMKVIQLGSIIKFKSKIGIVDYVISEITENRDAFFEVGAVEYDVFVSKTLTSKENLFWQRFPLRPDGIEYEFNPEEEFIV
jgi:hypothetical protein